MNTITDNTNGKLKEIVDFADNNKLSVELWSTLSRFFRHMVNGNNVELYPDFAPYSLTFAIKDNEGNLRMNGGFIFHGKTNGSSPNFSVSLDGDTKPHWSIHT